MTRPDGALAWAWALEALAWLAVAAIALRALPFATLMRLSGSRVTGPVPAGAARPGLWRPVRWAVLAAARRAPWRAVCMDRGLAAQVMLRRRGVPARLCYGARSDGARGPLAHVWVRMGDQVVVGGEGADRFALLAEFPAPARGCDHGSLD